MCFMVFAHVEKSLNPLRQSFVRADSKSGLKRDGNSKRGKFRLKQYLDCLHFFILYTRKTTMKYKNWLMFMKENKHEKISWKSSTSNLTLRTQSQTT